MIELHEFPLLSFIAKPDLSYLFAANRSGKKVRRKTCRTRIFLFPNNTVGLNFQSKFFVNFAKKSVAWCFIFFNTTTGKVPIVGELDVRNIISQY